MANGVDPDQAAPIGAVCSGSTLFASVLKFVSNVRQLFAADDFSRRHLQMRFFLSALRVKYYSYHIGASHFVCFDSLRPSQQFFSHVWMCLSVLNQY